MTKLYTFFIFCFLFSANLLFAQQATIKGTIYNGKTKETIPGVNVIISPTKGVVSDIDGKFIVAVDPGKITITFKYIGYGSLEKTYELKPGQTITDNVNIYEESMVIEGVVVSAGKFEQKLSDVTISMEILKPSQIENQNTNLLNEAINKLPGVDIYDGQPSIRGGSGYSYGAGSRVLVMMDDMPLLAPDAGDAKWNYMPIENISQVEVLKGASSALFGSSALNGVINLRTAFPKDKPSTKISINNGVYMNPKRKELIWWDDMELPYAKSSAGIFFFPLSNFGIKNPGFGAISFCHSRKISQVDLVVGGNLFMEQGFRTPNYENHERFNVNLRYRVKKIQGLSFGLNGNYMYANTVSFFLWQNSDSGAWRQRTDAISTNAGYRTNIDPYFMYFNKKGSKYSLKMRYYRQTNRFADDPAKNNDANLYYGDYQYQHNFKGKHNLTAGLSGSYSQSQAVLFGKHDGLNLSLYGQYDAKFWKKFTVSLGVRAEYYRIDTAQSESSFSYKIKGKVHTLPITPVFRVGANYQAAKYTFIRASFGQGYRFPSIAEKFIKASVGGLNIFPNRKIGRAHV